MTYTEERTGEIMTSCISEKEFNRFVEDSLSEEELIQLESHLKSCEFCSKEFEKWKEFKEILLPITEISVPPSLQRKVMEGIRKESIHPAPRSLNYSRFMMSAVLLMMIGNCFQLYYKPFTDTYLIDSVGHLSELVYNLFSFLGIDMGSVMSLFRIIAPLLNKLLWMFVTSTLMLIAGFTICISKGRRGNNRLTNQ